MHISKVGGGGGVVERWVDKLVGGGGPRVTCCLFVEGFGFSALMVSVITYGWMGGLGGGHGGPM